MCCKNCSVARYCSVQCQKNNSKEGIHKVMCPFWKRWRLIARGRGESEERFKKDVLDFLARIQSDEGDVHGVFIRFWMEIDVWWNGEAVQVLRALRPSGRCSIADLQPEERLRFDEMMLERERARKQEQEDIEETTAEMSLAEKIDEWHEQLGSELELRPEGCIENEWMKQVLGMLKAQCRRDVQASAA